MNKKLQLLILFLSIGIYTTIFAQTQQSNFINYQGVASDAAGAVMADQSITVGIVLRYATTGAAEYAENHSITTDANGVFSLKIGNGAATTGTYNTFQWPGIAVFATVSINGTEIGTTELLAVPYAINAGNVQWYANGNDIENANSGTVQVISNLEVGANIQLQLGPAANEISIDGTLAGNSDKAIPTEKAVKTYVDANAGGGVTKIDDLSDAKSDNDGTDNGSSLFLGIDAGANDDGSDNRNMGIGFQALSNNTTGNSNTANGYNALRSNTTGGFNIANGVSALFSNTTGSSNTANGREALSSNTTGGHNTANGREALRDNATGNHNTANGSLALRKNTTGIRNTANGVNALFSNTTGNHNTAIGRQALQNSNSSFNVAVGNDALNDLATGSNNIGIGADSQVPNASASHQVRIGNNQITYAGIQVAWTITSDAAWKDDIQPLPYGLKMVTQLKPVDYVRKNNENKAREIGFIAQDVEVLLNKLGYTNSGILTTADNGRLSLRYNDFIPVLTKAVQELSDKTTALEKMNREFLKRIETLESKQK